MSERRGFGFHEGERLKRVGKEKFEQKNRSATPRGEVIIKDLFIY